MKLGNYRLAKELSTCRTISSPWLTSCSSWCSRTACCGMMDLGSVLTVTPPRISDTKRPAQHQQQHTSFRHFLHARRHQHARPRAQHRPANA